MDTRIYVMTHKQYTKPDDDLYRTLHVGKAISQDLGYEGDDTGEQISNKNKNYCELTGMYWIWKNVSCDIVGICHYRRYFICNENFINQKKIEELLQDYDVIVPNSSFTREKNLEEHYRKIHHWENMEICHGIIQEKYPEYEDAFNLCMKCNLFSLGNMVITRKEIYNAYCDWLFDILFEVEKHIDIDENDAFQARVMGYFSERLFRVWLLNHQYRIREEEVRLMNPEDQDNAVKAVDLKYRYASLILKDVIERYKSAIVLNQAEYDEKLEPRKLDNSLGVLECASPMNVNFYGKVPVGICWWQGLDGVPDLVKMCIHSIVRNLPKNAELHVITFENLGQYVTFPDWIIDKFNEGKISMAHLSDILRAGLLYRYGGVWIDATYYMSEPLGQEWFQDGGFLTQRMEHPMWKADISQGRWAGNLLKGEAGNILFRFMLESFYEYWKKQDSLIDYYLIDYVIALAYENLDEVKNMINNCTPSQRDVFGLSICLHKKYNQAYYEHMAKDTQVFKLTYKNVPPIQNVIGEDTFYGYLFKKEFEDTTSDALY